MLSWNRPTPEDMRKFLQKVRKQPYSYRHLGITHGETVSRARGYIIDHNRVQLGYGVNTLRQAVDAMRHWTMFTIPWIQLFSRDTAIRTGETVVVIAHHLGIYSLNGCRIVYTLNELAHLLELAPDDDPDLNTSWHVEQQTSHASRSLRRFGFAYGTLLEHMESGEERFLIEYCEEDQSVFYDLLAVSRPGNVLTRLGYPVARHLQKQFARGSKKAMQDACPQ